MIKELHGKKYYVDLGDNYQIVIEAQSFLTTLESLQDETFGLRKTEDKHWIIYSDSRVEAFRGQKYSDWERFKRYVYKLKRA